jgi:hypothetical protein
MNRREPSCEFRKSLPASPVMPRLRTSQSLGQPVCGGLTSLGQPPFNFAGWPTSGNTSSPKPTSTCSRRNATNESTVAARRTDSELAVRPKARSTRAAAKLLDHGETPCCQPAGIQAIPVRYNPCAWLPALAAGPYLPRVSVSVLPAGVSSVFLTHPPWSRIERSLCPRHVPRVHAQPKGEDSRLAP